MAIEPHYQNTLFHTVRLTRLYDRREYSIRLKAAVAYDK